MKLMTLSLILLCNCKTLSYFGVNRGHSVGFGIILSGLKAKWLFNKILVAFVHKLARRYGCGFWLLQLVHDWQIDSTSIFCGLNYEVFGSPCHGMQRRWPHFIYGNSLN